MSEGGNPHPIMRWKPSPAMAVALVSLFVSLGGVTWAAINDNSVRSKHIKDGQVKEPDLGLGAVTTAKVADESLIGDDFTDETVTGSKIVDDTITGSKVEDGSLDGADIENGSLSGADIDESSLSGLTTASGANCCSIKTAALDIGTPYSPAEPGTFVTLSARYELRSAASADQDVVRLCDTTGTTFAQLAYADLTGNRETTVFEGAPRCHSWDINGSGSDGFVGDIEIEITSPGITVWGSTATSGFMGITVFTHH